LYKDKDAKVSGEGKCQFVVHEDDNKAEKDIDDTENFEIFRDKKEERLTLGSVLT
jgi:hypothetical protein